VKKRLVKMNDLESIEDIGENEIDDLDKAIDDLDLDEAF